MSYKVSFLDNQICGVDDFNSILADIANGGVVSEDFAGTEAYQMSKINVVTKGIASQGVAISEKSLACTVKTEGVYIAPGFGIFGSGAKIKVVESELVSFDDVNNVYVYAYHDIRNNLAGFAANSEGFPTETDGEFYVLPLCQIIDGVFTDRREYAKAKVRVCDTYNTVQKREMITPGKSYHNQEIELDVGGERINFIIFRTVNNGHDIWIVEEPEYGKFEIKKGGTYGDVSSVSFSTYVDFTDFRRGNNGELLVTHRHYAGGGPVEYILYSSVYEEVAE